MHKRLGGQPASATEDSAVVMGISLDGNAPPRPEQADDGRQVECKSVRVRQTLSDMNPARPHHKRGMRPHAKHETQARLSQRMSAESGSRCMAKFSCPAIRWEGRQDFLWEREPALSDSASVRNNSVTSKWIVDHCRSKIRRCWRNGRWPTYVGIQHINDKASGLRTNAAQPHHQSMSSNAGVAGLSRD